jgi:hypothetical protein
VYGELPSLDLADGSGTHPGFPVVLQSYDPPHTAVLRLPTNDELLEYLAAQKSLYRSVGRGGKGEDVPNPKADLRLFTAIRLDKSGVEFDADEANYAINQITRHRVTACERSGNTYVIALQTMFGPTTHTVRIPYQKELAAYRRDVLDVRDKGRGVEERRFPPEVPCKLYDKVIVGVTGYAPNLIDHSTNPPTGLVETTTVPPHHKRSVVAELVSAYDALDPDLDPN